MSYYDDDDDDDGYSTEYVPAEEEEDEEECAEEEHASQEQKDSPENMPRIAGRKPVELTTKQKQDLHYNKNVAWDVMAKYSEKGMTYDEMCQCLEKKYPFMISCTGI